MMLRRSMTFSHVVYAAVFPGVAAVLALVAVLILTMRYVETPRRLIVAAGPPGGTEAQLMAALAKSLDRDGGALRLSLRAVEGPAEAARALDQGAADLAVIRSDSGIPTRGAAVAVLHNDVAVLAATRASGITKLSGLAGKRVGIVPGTALNAALFGAVIAEYDIAPAHVQQVLVAPDEAQKAPADRKLDALFAVGPLRGPTLPAAIAAFATDAPRREISLIPIDAAEGMAARGPAYQKVDLPQGLFPGAPPLPDDDFVTLGVAVRLEARANLSQDVVTNLTRRLFETRRALEAQAPLAAAMEKPEGDRGAFEVIHPGAAAYYGDSEKSFMDLYGDWIYIGAMLLSGLGSGAAAMVGVTRARARKAALALIDQLIDLKQVAHTTMSLPKLAELDHEIEDLSTRGLRFARDHNFDEAGLAALRLAIDEARRAINDQCNELEEKPALLANAAAAKGGHVSQGGQI
ncbi:TAXI family TRAP transporter solute-binding subunit [Methylocapsa palsarum]|uniref:TRAP transporter solute receptor, TAXI family n=1 Tax=Methylocapsa palsarum TaxID=1612308 RepID=A0A1I3Y6P3_9HYPH|nr:TAXI family TRAP transporter solute-binding subunit [Methylocapsa palsarum]SFK27059.1 TRAP transporter solute receptor, TAXI family [Methylocapsa palsarum]